MPLDISAPELDIHLADFANHKFLKIRFGCSFDVVQLVGAKLPASRAPDPWGGGWVKNHEFGMKNKIRLTSRLKNKLSKICLRPFRLRVRKDI